MNRIITNVVFSLIYHSFFFENYNSCRNILETTMNTYNTDIYKDSLAEISIFSVILSQEEFDCRTIREETKRRNQSDE